jgi:hypothetical protein
MRSADALAGVPLCSWQGRSVNGQRLLSVSVATLGIVAIHPLGSATRSPVTEYTIDVHQLVSEGRHATYAHDS